MGSPSGLRPIPLATVLHILQWRPTVPSDHQSKNQPRPPRSRGGQWSVLNPIHKAFDVLAVDGVDVTGQPYGRRREVLDSLMVVDASPVLSVPRNWVDVSPAEMLAVCEANAMEGIVAKLVDSPYRPGRSPFWVKSMCRATSELAIVGHIDSRAAGGSVSCLLVAGHDADGDLVLVGQVGTGMSQRERRRLYELLEPMSTDVVPVRNPTADRRVRWVTPTYVGEVAYREYTPGRGLRHPSWKGLRNVPAAQSVLPRETAS